MRMLTSTPGSWKYHQTLGTGLEQFIGELNINNIIPQIKTRLMSFFKSFGLVPMINAFASSEDATSIVCMLKFYSVAGSDIISTAFKFNMENGIVNFIKDDIFEEDVITNTKPSNKYMRRR
jgi:hypothetical protein